MITCIYSIDHLTIIVLFLFISFQIYADRRRHAVDNPIEVGSKVVIKEMAPPNKLSLKYKPEPFSVIERNGSEIIVQSDTDGRRYRRNVTHTKLLPASDQAGETVVDEEPIENANVEPNEPIADAVADVPVERPKRAIVKPARYQ